MTDEDAGVVSGGARRPTRSAAELEREIEACLAADAAPAPRPAATRQSTSRCAICGARKTGSTDFCRTHKFAIRRAARRVRDEHLVVDRAGESWWIWDRRGDVLVSGQDSRPRALAALDLGGDEP